MSRRSKDTELRVGGLSVAGRFTLYMMLILAPLLALSGWLLFRNVDKIAEESQEGMLAEAVLIRHEEDKHMGELRKARVLYEDANDAYKTLRNSNESALRKIHPDLRSEEREEQMHGEEAMYAAVQKRFEDLEAIRAVTNVFWEQSNSEVKKIEDVVFFPVGYGKEGKHGIAYVHEDRDVTTSLVVPDSAENVGKGLLGLILGIISTVILVAAGVAGWVGSQVGRPIQSLVADIRQIAQGNFKHRTRVKGGGEVALLARSVDRMAKDLSEAQETELELQMREREVDLASEVRESLLPNTMPEVSGFDLSCTHIACEEMGGDFYDFFELPDGRIGFLVCDVSGQGVPGALVGSTARAYLRASLSQGGDIKEALQEVNVRLAQDVRRGMYVTALYVVLNPTRRRAMVACAGHKIPLMRYTANDQKMRLIQPEGIALGFDKGPIFNRTLSVQEVPLDKGDRLVLANTGAVALVNPAGTEFGEKELYAKALRHGARPSQEFVERMHTIFESYAEEEALPRDILVLTFSAC